jgi:hypothetical protein
MSRLPNSGQLFALVNRREILGPEDPDNPVVNARRLSREECASVMQEALGQLQSTYKNLFSCFDNLGPYGMHKTVEAVMQENRTGLELIDGAAAYGSAQELNDAVRLAYETAFVQALEAQALNRLQLQDLEGKTVWNELAQSEYFDMVRRVRASKTGTRRSPSGEVIPTPTPAPVVPVEDPIERCIQDFKDPNFGSDRFRKKYMNDSRMRAVYEAAVQQGRI